MVIRFSKESRRFFNYFFIVVTIMRIVYEQIYVHQIATAYRYEGFLNDYNLLRSIISWLLMYSLLPFIVTAYKKASFSGTVLLVLYFIHFVPGTILYAHTDLKYIWLWYVYFIIIYGLSSLAKKTGNQATHKYMNKRSIYLLAGLLSLIVVFVWVYYAHGRMNLGFSDVYSIRLETRSYAMPAIIRYVFASMKVILPIFVVWSLNCKNYIMTAIFSGIQLLIFFTDGTKSTVLSLLISIGGYFLLKNDSRKISFIPYGIVCIGVLSELEYFINHTFFITGYFIRRIMFVPHQLNISYFDFFTSHEPDYFRGSILRLLGFQSPYGNIAMKIGEYISESTNLSANNGLFSDAIGNLGIVGVFIMPIAIVFMLLLIDKFSSDLTIGTIIGAIIAFTPALISSSFFTLILTHGVFAMLIIFYFIPREGKMNIPNSKV